MHGTLFCEGFSQPMTTTSWTHRFPPRYPDRTPPALKFEIACADLCGARGVMSSGMRRHSCLWAGSDDDFRLDSFERWLSIGMPLGVDMRRMVASFLLITTQGVVPAPAVDF